MAADQTLVEGAFKAHRFYGRDKYQGLKDLGEKLSELDNLKPKQVSDSETSPKAETIKADIPDAEPGVQDKTDVLIDEVTNKDEPEVVEEGNADQAALEINNETTPEENVEIADVLKESKDQINEALLAKDNTTVEQKMRNLDRDKEDIDIFAETIAQVGSDWTNRSKENGSKTPHGYGMALENDPENKEWLMAVINSKQRLEVDDSDPDNPRYGVYGPNDEFMTPKQLREYLVQFEVDNNSFNQLDEMTYNYKDQGKKSGTKEAFDFDDARKNVRQVVENGNLRSLTFDPGFGGTSYVDDLINGDEMNNITYASLGLKPPAGDKDGKIGVEDGIDGDLKKEIVNNFTAKDGVYFEEYKNSVVDYYAKHMQKNFEFGQSGVRANRNATRNPSAKTAEDYLNE